MKNASKQLTKQDVNDAVKNALINFASKDDLNSFEKRIGDRFATKDDLNSLEKRLGDRFASKEDIITFKDAILKEIKDMRDEVAIVGGQRDTIEDHDQRIETIEKHLHIQPAA